MCEDDEPELMGIPSLTMPLAMTMMSSPRECLVFFPNFSLCLSRPKK
jgi:hypothetical protein